MDFIVALEKDNMSVDKNIVKFNLLFIKSFDGTILDPTDNSWSKVFQIIPFEDREFSPVIKFKKL